MTRIVTYAHRYKRPPRKRKAVALEVPAIVTRATKKRRLGRDQTAERERCPGEDSTTTEPQRDQSVIAHEKAPSAIVTARRRKHTLHAHLVENLTPEEFQRRGDAADALFREIVRRAREERS